MPLNEISATPENIANPAIIGCIITAIDNVIVAAHGLFFMIKRIPKILRAAAKA